MSLRLSVVVCTHNRPDDLERCLEALGALADEPDDRLAEALARLDRER